MDTPVDKYGQPVLNGENRLKLALFGINLRGGVTLSDVEGKCEATWEENRRLAHGRRSATSEELSHAELRCMKTAR